LVSKRHNREMNSRSNLSKLLHSGLSIALLALALLSCSPAWANNSPPAPPPEERRPSTRAPITPNGTPTTWPQLAQNTVLYLGETHDQSADHALQLAALQALQQQSLAIGLEMFQRPYQSVLDRYSQGEIDEAQLVRDSDYEKRWGFPWELYAPIGRFARTHRLPLIALNTPTEVTRKVGRQGLDALSFADKRFIPPLSEIILGPDLYRDRLRPIYDSIHHGQGSSGKNKSGSGFERFFQAQVLWDETMADRISQFVLAHPDTRLVVIVGQGHVMYGDGIPDRVARRLKSRLPGFQQATILLNPEPDLGVSDPPAADYFWRGP
jgi:uncharacterized iron-regulated protein